VKQIIAIAAGLTALVALSQGAAAQYAPSIPASPGPNKAYAYFQQDDAVCQQWANQQVAYAPQQANNNVGAGVVGGAIGGALLGGLLGGGRGAAIGAGAGAVTGGVAGSADAQAAAADGQGRFDALYQQCMVGRGNMIGYQPPPAPPRPRRPRPPPQNDTGDDNSNQGPSGDQ
jgi:uncharacterized protein YcfJ